MKSWLVHAGILITIYYNRWVGLQPFIIPLGFRLFDAQKTRSKTTDLNGSFLMTGGIGYNPPLTWEIAILLGYLEKNGGFTTFRTQRSKRSFLKKQRLLKKHGETMRDPKKHRTSSSGALVKLTNRDGWNIPMVHLGESSSGSIFQPAMLVYRGVNSWATWYFA